VIEGLASWVFDQALDPAARDEKPIAARLGAISTSTVSTRSTLLVARFRYHLERTGAAEDILCEEVVPLAYTGPAEAPKWVTPEESERLLAARPEKNLLPTAIDQQVKLLLEALPRLRQSLEAVAQERATAQLAAHERVRESLKARGRVSVKPVLPVDILGAYILLPR